MSTMKQAALGMVVVVAMMLFAPVPSVAGDLDPSAAPGPTMKTLDEIGAWSQTLTCDSTSNCPRFKIVLGGAAVLDKETGLVWEKSPSTTTVLWVTAAYTCQNKAVGNRKGWRLPTVEELSSLVDPTRSNPALPAGHPFTNVQSSNYWSATTYVFNTAIAWEVYFGDGLVDGYPRNNYLYLWCVRGGQGYDAY